MENPDLENSDLSKRWIRFRTLFLEKIKKVLAETDKTEESYNNALSKLTKIEDELNTVKTVSVIGGISSSGRDVVKDTIETKRDEIKRMILKNYDKHFIPARYAYFFTTNNLEYYNVDNKVGMKLLGKYKDHKRSDSPYNPERKTSDAAEGSGEYFFEYGSIDDSATTLYTKKQSDTGGRKTTKQNYFRKTRRIGKTNRVPKKTRTNGSRNRIRKPRGVISQTNRKSRKH